MPEYSLPFEYRTLDYMPYANAGKIDFKTLEGTVNNEVNRKKRKETIKFRRHEQVRNKTCNVVKDKGAGVENGADNQ